jgi:transaldolase
MTNSSMSNSSMSNSSMSNYVLYADSADTSLTDPLLRQHLVVGVTTNPTILRRSAKTAADLPELHAHWTELGAKEVFFQVWGTTEDELLGHGREIAALGTNVVVKLPAIAPGFAAAGKLIAEGGTVLMTAVYSAAQAITSNAIGARYIAPYLGRLYDSGENGLEIISGMQQLLLGSDTEILAASLRSPQMIVELARCGVRRFTAAPAVLTAALQHQTSDSAAVVFEDDAAWRAGTS